MAAGKFNFMDIMNASAKRDIAGDVCTYTEIYLSPYEVVATESNFYSQENIEELADSFITVGQQQPTVLARVSGEYRIVSGHRRNAANIYNIERGTVEETKIRYLYRDMSTALFELSLLVGNAFTRKLTPYEEVEQSARLKVAIQRAKDEDGIEIAGRIRDMVADVLDTSATQVARMDKINAALEPEAKEQFKAGKMGITAAYEVAKLEPEQQKEIAAAAAEAQEEIKPKDIAQRIKESQATKAEPPQKEAPPQTAKSKAEQPAAQIESPPDIVSETDTQVNTVDETVKRCAYCGKVLESAYYELKDKEVIEILERRGKAHVFCSTSCLKSTLKVGFVDNGGIDKWTKS